VQLKSDLESRNLLDTTIQGYYRKNGNRALRNFLHTEDKSEGWFYSHFLLDRKHVIRYGHGQDRGAWVGGFELGIGPHYFSPSAFWSHEASLRFSMEASTEAVEQGLVLLDEFFASSAS
jgi:hypothetical protein